MKNTTVTAIVSIFIFAFSVSVAEAKHRVTYAQVIEARPIYEYVTHSTPREYCTVETVAYRDRGGNKATGTVVGGLIGATLGHELGNSQRNKHVGTVAGGLLGAAIGHDLSRKSSGTTRYRDQEVCQTEYRRHQTREVTGYAVSYRHQGRIYNTRTAYHPGKRIAIEKPHAPRHYR